MSVETRRAGEAQSPISIEPDDWKKHVDWARIGIITTVALVLIGVCALGIAAGCGARGLPAALCHPKDYLTLAIGGGLIGFSFLFAAIYSVYIQRQNYYKYSALSESRPDIDAVPRGLKQPRHNQRRALPEL